MKHNVNCAFSAQNHAGVRPISIKGLFTSIVSLGRFGQIVGKPKTIATMTANAPEIAPTAAQNNSEPIDKTLIKKLKIYYWVVYVSLLIMTILFWIAIIKLRKLQNGQK